MQHPKLTAEKRELLGKKVKQLRRLGKTPANVYGKHIASRPVLVDTVAFNNLYNEVGETGLIDLTIDNESVPVLVKNPQYHYRTKEPLHVDFYQVNLKEKITSFVPVRLIGEPKPITEKLGILIQSLNEIEVEALPEELPEYIDADTSILEEVGEILEVSDLKAPAGVTIITSADTNVAQVSELVVVEKEPEPVVAEGETPVVGEEPVSTDTTEPAAEDKKE